MRGDISSGVSGNATDVAFRDEGTRSEPPLMLPFFTLTPSGVRMPFLTSMMADARRTYHRLTRRLLDAYTSEKSSGVLHPLITIWKILFHF